MCGSGNSHGDEVSHPNELKVKESVCIKHSSGTPQNLMKLPVLLFCPYLKASLNITAVDKVGSSHTYKDGSKRLKRELKNQLTELDLRQLNKKRTRQKNNWAFPFLF